MGDEHFVFFTVLFGSGRPWDGQELGNVVQISVLALAVGRLWASVSSCVETGSLLCELPMRCRNVESRPLTSCLAVSLCYIC